ncbi:MAG: hypothetical protein KQH59_20300 [Desulfobulbaceae bacterium]|nr:hypothetical protein [Desulfobulbaceae bacterium]
MAATKERHKERGGRSGGFTLLETVLVIGLLGLLAAMAVPFVGRLDDTERARRTRETMEQIRTALLGDPIDPERLDEHGCPVVSGYVGDLGAWPDLWETLPQYRETAAGTERFDPADPNNLNVFVYRPAGSFGPNGWRWRYAENLPPSSNSPFRRLTHDEAYNQDHIGGLETENEGQPRGLWTDDPSGDCTEPGPPEREACLNPQLWRGPYLAPPRDRWPADAEHYAKTDADYAALGPATIIGIGEDWEDGDYDPDDGDPGEYGDEKEQFRLLQTDGRLADGWGRALRFFITADPDRPGETLFWVISEGPDRKGTYPKKGEISGITWTIDPDDIMSETYDEDDAYNRDNIVMKVFSRDWRPRLEEREACRRAVTEATLERLRRALVGSQTPAEGGFNDGFTGALCRLPRLFRWEPGDPATLDDDTWDDRDAADGAYTKGSARGLWTDTPNALDSGDDLAAPTAASRGIGWRGPNLPAPFGNGGNEVLRDGWGRELLFFHDAAAAALLVLSRGGDGRFNFLDSDTLPAGAPDGTNDYLEPASPTEAVDVSLYNPADTDCENDQGEGCNADNVTLLVTADHSRGAIATLHLLVYNATTGPNGTKTAFYRGWDFGADAPLADPPLSPSAADLTDEGGDGFLDDWYLPSAFVYDETTDPPAVSGTRQLVLWTDSDGDGIPDTDEEGIILPFDLRVQADLAGGLRTVRVDAALHFSPLP